MHELRSFLQEGEAHKKMNNAKKGRIPVLILSQLCNASQIISHWFRSNMDLIYLIEG